MNYTYFSEIIQSCFDFCLFEMPSKTYNVGMESTSESEEQQTKKPDNTAFKQQRLPAWQPILTPKSVFPTFMIVALIFIPIGVVLLLASNDVVEASVDYTNCSDANQSPCSTKNVTCICTVDITVPRAMQGNVYVYYGLTNFFQNHRRYVKSRDDNQLVGQAITNSSISRDCEPYRHSNGFPIAPCGAIANSLFNDTFNFSRLSVIRTNIAWDTDHNDKFNNPDPKDNLTAAFEGFVKPVYWSRPVYELDVDNISNNGYKNEAFEVWMRTAAFPTFRKLYGQLNQSLEPGVYQVRVNYNFPVTAFKGTKKIILSTTSFVGGKNNFLGIAYIVVGALSFVVGAGLLIVHFVTRKRNQ